jgi:hypothetical protein
MAGPTVSGLTTSLVEKGPEIFKKHVNDLDLTTAGIQVYKMVSKPIALPKVAASGNPRPYTAADSTGAGAAITDRTLTVYQSKWDFDIDPEQFRNTYLNQFAGKPDAPEGYQFIMDTVAKAYFAQINDNTIWSGVRNASGTTAAAIATGFESLISTELIGGGMTAITTGAITSANAVTQLDTFVDGLPAWMKKQGCTILCSAGVWGNYRTHYRTLNTYSFEKNPQGEYNLDGYDNIKLKWVSWLPTASDRLIATIPGNLIMGTDSNGVEVHTSLNRNIIEVRVMMPVGFQIADVEALFVNNVS